MDTKDAAVPDLALLGVETEIVVARVEAVGSIRQAAETEMEAERIANGNRAADEGMREDEGVMEVVGEDVAAPMEIHCEPVVRTLRPSMVPPGRPFSCTVITSSF